MNINRNIQLTSHGMVDAPTSQAVHEQIPLATANTSFGDKDIEKIPEMVRNALSKLRGTPDDAAIQHALSVAGIPPEFASLAYKIAKEQTDPNKFNLFSSQQGTYAFLDMGKTTEALANNALSPSNTQDLKSGIVKSILGLS